MNPSNLTDRPSTLRGLSLTRAPLICFSAFAAAALAGLSVPSLRAADFVFQAESFTSSALVADPSQPGFAIFADSSAFPNGAGQYIGTLSDGTPTTPNSTATFNLNFPSAGDYTLYVRALAEGVDDTEQNGNDSFFIPQGFGANPTFGNRVNAFNATTPNPTPLYHWVNLVTKAGLEYGGAIDTTSSGLFTVPSAGPQTFVIGGRENGLRLDAFVFSTNGNLSAASLDSLANVPEPSIGMLALSGIGGLLGLARRRGA